MKGIYIISDYKPYMKSCQDSIGMPENQIIPLENIDKDEIWHDWITEIITEKNIEKLIVPISIPTEGAINVQGLKIALHIRLNYELSIEQRLIPIIFLSDNTISDIILEYGNLDLDNNPVNLLFTKGVYLSSFDKDDIQITLEKSVSCPEADYKKFVLDKLKLLQKADSGKHSIANAWGCYKMSQVIGIREKIFSSPNISEKLKILYAKYLICYNDIYTESKYIDLDPIKSLSTKNILFIDDQADEGWNLVMGKVFEKAKSFVSINSAQYKNNETKKFHNYDGFIKDCKNQIGKDWNLIIIDLRLNPEFEDIDNEIIKPTELSGYKLVDDFLKFNEGYQIIVFTASNKIWNINSALERGATAYYIKESPEFNYSLPETKIHFSSFKEHVKKCFENAYLRKLYPLLQQAKNENTCANQSFINESNLMLDIAWNLLKQGQLDFSYLTLFQILESFANIEYKHWNDSIVINESLQPMIQKRNNEYEWKLTFVTDKLEGDFFKNEVNKIEDKIRANSLYKISCLLAFRFGKSDEELQQFGKLNENRHRIAHKGNKSFVSEKDITALLELIKTIRST